MIRLIQRRLIIPRGDTGSFTVPTLGSVESGDVAVFSIYDPMSHKTIFEKEIAVEGETITVEFTHQDTVNLIPNKYVWDIKIYKNPQYEVDDNDGSKLIGGDEINSYYAAFSLPVCEIREIAQNI